MGDVLTGAALAGPSVEEMQDALVFLADYCADRVVERLRDAMDKVRS